MNIIKSCGFLIISLIIFFIFIITIDNKTCFSFPAEKFEPSVHEIYLKKIRVEADGLPLNISNEKGVKSKDAHGDERFFFEAAVGYAHPSNLFNYFDALFERAVITVDEVASIESNSSKIPGGVNECVFSFVKEPSAVKLAGGGPRAAHYSILKRSVTAADSKFNVKISKFCYIKNIRIEIKGAARQIDGLLAFIDSFSEYGGIEKFSSILIDKKIDNYAGHFYYSFEFTAALR